MYRVSSGRQVCRLGHDGLMSRTTTQWCPSSVLEHSTSVVTVRSHLSTSGFESSELVPGPHSLTPGPLPGSEWWTRLSIVTRVVGPARWRHL